MVIPGGRSATAAEAVGRILEPVREGVGRVVGLFGAEQRRLVVAKRRVVEAVEWLRLRRAAFVAERHLAAEKEAAVTARERAALRPGIVRRSECEAVAITTGRSECEEHWGWPGK